MPKSSPVSDKPLKDWLAKRHARLIEQHVALSHDKSPRHELSGDVP